MWHCKFWLKERQDNKKSNPLKHSCKIALKTYSQSYDNFYENCLHFLLITAFLAVIKFFEFSTLFINIFLMHFYSVAFLFNSISIILESKHPHLVWKKNLIKYKVFHSWSKWQKATTFGTSETSVVDVGYVKFIGPTYVVCLHTLHSSVLFGFCRLKQKRKCFSCNSHPGQNSHFCHLCISSFQKKLRFPLGLNPGQLRQKPKPSLKNGTANAICWNSLGLFRDYGLFF